MSSKEMLHKKSGFPEKDELVVAKVKRILPHCVFLDLPEYDNREGMLHISEIASGWVKNIRTHLQENQQVICKVMSVDEKKGYIDLSLKRVSAGERKAKLNDWKTEKKMSIILGLIGKKLNKESEIDKIAGKIVEEYGSLSGLFSDIDKDGPGAVESLGLPKAWQDEILKSVNEQIKSHRVRIAEVIQLKSFESDGVERIKKVIGGLSKASGFETSITYLGTPKYQVAILANDYKKAEDAMDDLMGQVERLSRELSVEFSREK